MIRAFKGEYPVSNPFGVYDAEAYARYPGQRHPGTDYPLPKGTRLYAGMSGYISRTVSVGWAGKGNELVITKDNVQRRYGHMDRIDVQDGQWVNEGDYVGLSGNTGYVLPPPTENDPNAGAHLHDEYKVNGEYRDLERALKEQENDVSTLNDDSLKTLAWALQGFDQDDAFNGKLLGIYKALYGDMEANKAISTMLLASPDWKDKIRKFQHQQPDEDAEDKLAKIKEIVNKEK